MFLYARNVLSDDVETMLRLFLPSSRHGSERIERERVRWNRLWAAGLPRGVIMEDLSRREGDRAVGLMVACAVMPELHDRIIIPGGPPLLDGIADAVEKSQASWIDESSVGRANAEDGLDLVICWIGYGDALYSIPTVTGLRSRIVRAFQDQNAGNRLRRFTLESEEKAVVERFEQYGLEPIREEAGRTTLSLHREKALSLPDLSTQRFFSYDPPVLGFTPAQRAILLLARQGYTDQEIATALDKTTDSVKKRWSGIYARFAQTFPGILASNRDGSRGAEKRRTLLAYLRDRPEELRPYGNEG